MAQVIQMSKYRAVTHEAPTPEFYCKRCDFDRFKLFPTGLIRCGKCGADMRNIHVKERS